MKWLFPAFMFCGGAAILSQWIPLWSSVLLLLVVGFLAYAQYEAHRGNE